MTRNLPNKSSSRAGRFKKKLVSEENLLREATSVAPKLKRMAEFYDKNEITASEFSALYAVAFLNERYPGQWLGAKSTTRQIEHKMEFPLSLLPEVGISLEPNVHKRLASFKTLADIFLNFSLKSTPETVNRAILSWSAGNYALELMFRIPSPSEVLTQQKYGRRCVTALIQENKINKYILGERDALSFLLHDLIHADHFYFHNECYQGQLGFYGLLAHCYESNHFQDFKENESFLKEFEYIIADMNAYAIHLLKCLKSALYFYHEDGELFFQEWINKLNCSQEERHALLALNSSQYQTSYDQVLLNFLHRWKMN